MKRIALLFTVSAAMLCNAYAFHKHEPQPGEDPGVRESYTAEELNQQQSAVVGSTPTGDVPVTTEPTAMPESIPSSDDPNAAQPLSASINQAPPDAAPNPPVEQETEAGKQVLQTVENDIQESKEQPWWKLPLQMAIFAGVGLAGFFGFTRWAAKNVPQPELRTRKTR